MISAHNIDAVFILSMREGITNIVFTKNRPLQLEGYLRSLRRYLPAALMRTVIIYKAGLFESEYDEVFNEFSDIQIVRECDFHSDVLNALTQVETEYILFGIDDVVFFDSVDFGIIAETFSQAGNSIFGFTLRFSHDSVELKEDDIIEEYVNGQTIYKVDWTNGKSAHSRYPFELCCTLYRTELVRQILEGLLSKNLIAKGFFKPDSYLIKNLWKINLARSTLKRFGYFFSPNTFESWPCRWCQNNSNKLPRFTYFQKLCASAVQVNMVNVSTINTFDGTFEQSVEVLNEKYKQGYRLDVDYLITNRPYTMSCGQKYFRLIKSES